MVDSSKRRKFDSEAGPNFFAEVVGDDLAVHLMQFLKPRDALHLAKTCRRMATVYKHERCRLRRWKKFSHLFFQLKSSKGSKKELCISGYGKTNEEWDHVFEFSDAKPQKAAIQIVLSDENAELAMTTARHRQWKRVDEEMGWDSDDEDPYYEATWTCFLRRGTQREGFVLLAKFISEHFAFRNLDIRGLNKELSQALSKFRFYTKDTLAIEKAEILDEEDLLSWTSMPPSRFFNFESSTPMTLSKMVFKDARFCNQKTVKISIEEPNHGTCNVGDEDLEEILLGKTEVELVNVETHVTTSGLKAFIEKWSHGEDEFSIPDWSFGMRLNAEENINAIYDELREGHELTEDTNLITSRRRFAVHNSNDANRRLHVSLDLVCSSPSSAPLLNIRLRESRRS